MVIATRKLSEIAEKIGAGGDPRAALIDGIGQKNIDGMEPAMNLILVATYVRNEKTKSGLIIGGDRTRAEDRFQGKIGLVLKLGPLVNAKNRPKVFGDYDVNVGDWIMYRTSDAHEFFFVDEKTGLDGSSARLIEDGLVMGRVQDPEAIY
jgi:co-chaperonin GroES (HSP10)